MVAASDGTFARDLRLHQTLGLSVLAADGEHRASVARRFGSTDHPEDLMVWDADGTARDIAASTGTMLYADYVDAGTYPVVLANKFGGDLPRGLRPLAGNHPAGARHQPLAGRIGESIAHEAVTAIDEGLSNRHFGSIAMDDEGLEPQRTTLIENGVLKAFLSDRAGEWRTGQPRTAAAGARAMRSPLPAGCATPSSPLAP